MLFCDKEMQFVQVLSHSCEVCVVLMYIRAYVCIHAYVSCRKESLRLLRKLCTFSPDAVLREVCSRVSPAEQQQSAPFATQLTEVVLSSLSTTEVCTNIRTYIQPISPPACLHCVCVYLCIAYLLVMDMCIVTR